MPKNLVLGLVAENENQALRASSESMGQILGTVGYRHEIIDLFDPNGLPHLSQMLQSGDVAFGYGFAGVGSRITTQTGANIWPTAGVPFANIWYDHPCYNYKQHSLSVRGVYHFYHIADHMQTRQTYLAPPFDKSAFMLPQAIGFNPALGETAWRDRIPKILYAKTAYNPTRFEEKWKKFSPALRQALHALAEEARQKPAIDLARAAASVFNAVGLDSSDLDQYMGVVQEVDAYMRAWRSDKLARALLAHEAVIAGRGWEYLDNQPHRAEIIDPFPASDFLNQLSRYRLAANTNPLWSDGLHERTILGMAAGCITLTDRSPRADELFRRFGSYHPFSWDDDLSDVIAEAVKKSANEPYDLNALRHYFYSTLNTTRTEWITSFLTAMGQTPLT